MSSGGVTSGDARHAFAEPPGQLHEVDVLPVVGARLRVERAGRALVADVDLTLTAERVCVIVGPNGAGKSLLLRLLAGLLLPDSGAVTWAGTAPDRARRPALGYVLQKPVLLRRTALANVVYALRAAGWSSAAAVDAARQALQVGGLRHLAETPARVLSGGEQQRLAVVRALSLRPAMVLCDEPSAHLDPGATRAIEELVRIARVAGTGVCWVTHDLGQARRLADEVLFMHEGRIVEHADAASFFKRPSSRAARDFVAGKL
jgi:tungstate transport system ATP-binding protein